MIATTTMTTNDDCCHDIENVKVMMRLWKNVKVMLR